MQQAVPTLPAGHSFARVPQAEINRSLFDRSHGHKTTFDAGYLVPIFRDMAFPGDTFRVRPSILARIATLLRPLMDRIFLDLHFWFVPLRLLQLNWVKLQGEQTDPNDSIAYSTPQIPFLGVSAVTVGSLFDYMGVPSSATLVPSSIAAWWALAYNLIFNTWYRDQNLQDSVYFNTGDGPHAASNFSLLRRGKRHDYFTAATPTPQKGNAVSLPVAISAPVTGTFTGPTANQTGTLAFPTTSQVTTADAIQAVAGGGQITSFRAAPNNENVTPTAPITANQMTFNVAVGGTGLVASSATAAQIAINDFRLAVATQQVLERDMRGGTRYPEIIRSHFGVISPDARLQRPEYLGGGTIPLGVHQVAQTAPGTTSNQADLSAFGIAAHSGEGIGFTQSFTEHGVVLGIISARADYTYQQGLPREYRYNTRYDYYLPTFANLGEQAVRNQEIYVSGNATTDDQTFGYQERWGEMRYKPSELSALMRTYVAGSIGSAWTVAQEFSGLPGLDATFIVENPPVDDVIAVPSEPHFILDAFFEFHAIRPLPLFSVPGLTRL